MRFLYTNILFGITLAKTLEEQYQFVYDYAPQIWLAEGNPILGLWPSSFPSSIEFFLNHTVIKKEHGYYNLETPENENPLEEQDWFAGQRPDEDGLGPTVLTLPFPVLTDQSMDPTEILLAPLEHKIQVFYFLFYPYNYGKYGYGNHVGDIETVAISFDKGVPVNVTCAQHETMETRRWNNVEKDKQTGNPILYSSWGSHATYFTRGLHIFMMSCIDFTDDYLQWNTGKNLKIIFPWEYSTDPFLKIADTEINWLLEVWNWGDQPQGKSLMDIQELSSGPTGFLNKIPLKKRIRELKKKEITCSGVERTCKWPFGLYSSKNSNPISELQSSPFKDVETFSFESINVTFGDYYNYQPDIKIGKGKFSTVHKGIDLRNGKTIALKYLKPVKLFKIEREIKILQKVRGGPNIIELLDIVIEPETNYPVLIFEYINDGGIKTAKLFDKFTDYDVRYNLYQLLKGIQHCHNMGIMHRDLKPGNIVIDHPNRKLRLIDFGLSEFYTPDPKKLKMGTKWYKGPELLIGNTLYDYSLDIWAVGCVMAEMVFQEMPFFHGDSNPDQLLKIVEVMGTDGLYKYARKYNIGLSPEIEELIQDERKDQQKWTDFIEEYNDDLSHPDALDLLDKMLRYDHKSRLTASQALKHKYFDPVRDDRKAPKKNRKRTNKRAPNGDL